MLVLCLGLLSGCYFIPEHTPTNTEVEVKEAPVKVEVIAPIERAEPWVRDVDGRILSDPENMIPKKLRE